MRYRCFKIIFRHQIFPSISIAALVTAIIFYAGYTFWVKLESQKLDLLRKELISSVTSVSITGKSLINPTLADSTYLLATSNAWHQIHQFLSENRSVRSVSVVQTQIIRFALSPEGELNVLFKPIHSEELPAADGASWTVRTRVDENLLNLQLAYRPQSPSSIIIIEMEEQTAVPIRVKEYSASAWHNLAAASNDNVIALSDYLNRILQVNSLTVLSQILLYLIISLLTMFIAFVLFGWSKAGSWAEQLDALASKGRGMSKMNQADGELERLLSPVILQSHVQLAEKNNQIEEERERLNQFYRASLDAIVIHHEGIPVFYNPAYAEITGYSDAELQTLRPFDLLRVEEDLLSEVREGRQPAVEATLRRSDGKILYVEIQARSITFRGQPAESIVIRDITHRKFMERELQMERMRQVKSVIDGQEKERQRLSRELHDGLGQNLVAIKLKLESIPHDKAGEFDATLTQVKQMFNHTIDEVRRISNNLMPAALKEFSLAVVLRNLCNEVESNSGVGIGLTVGVLPEPLDQLLKTYVYRIVQEALTNVIKHSGANRANVTVYSDFSNLHLQIEDNGTGFNPNRPTDTGNGLYNMKERAILLNGKINIISSAGKGTKIVAEFPLNQTKTSANGQQD